MKKLLILFTLILLFAACQKEVVIKKPVESKKVEVTVKKENEVFKMTKPFININHMSKIVSLAFSNDNKYLISGSLDNTVKIWSINSGSLIKTIYTKDYSKLNLLDEKNIKFDKNEVINNDDIKSFLPDITNLSIAIKSDKYIAVGYQNGVIKIFDIKTKRENRVFNLKQEIKVKNIILNDKEKYEISKIIDFYKFNELLKSSEFYLVTFNNNEWVKIDKDGYFVSSQNGIRYINILTSYMNPVSVIPYYYKFYKIELFNKSMIFSDQFLDNRNDWSIDVNKSELAKFEIKNKKFIFHHLSNRGSYRNVKFIDTQKDFRADIALKHISGSDTFGYGITWGDGEDRYTFLIANKYFLVGFYDKYSKWNKMYGWEGSDYINNSVNVLSIEKSGNFVNLMINGVLVYRFYSVKEYLESIGFIVNANQIIEYDYIKLIQTEDYNYPPFEKNFFEKFNDNSNGWVIKNDEVANTEIKNGHYVFEYKKDNDTYISWIANNGIQEQNFTLEVDATSISGDEKSAYGLMWGEDTNPYVFVVAKDGYFVYGKYVNREWKLITRWIKNKYIKTDGSPNHLKVQKIGNRVVLSVNSHILTESTTYTMDSNKIGFILSGEQKVLFDNLKLSKENNDSTSNK